MGPLILKYQLVISMERKNKYILTKNLFKISERAGVVKICLADLLKTHLGVEMDTQDRKSSCGRALPCSDELCCTFDQLGVAIAGATNSVNARQSGALTVSLLFSPPHPMLLTLPPQPKGILYSPQFHSHQKMVAH